MNVFTHRHFCQDAPCGSAIFVNKKSRLSAQELNVVQNFQDAPHGSAIFLKKIKTLRTGARFYSICSGRSARERDFHRNFQDAPHGSAIFLKIFRTPRTGSRFFSKFSRRSARERDFDQKRTIWSGSVWYRIGIEIIPWKIKILTTNPAKPIPGLYQHIPSRKSPLIR